MTIVLNTAASISDFAVTSKTLNYTCGASDNLLLVLVGTDINPAVTTSGVTYNGISLTKAGNSLAGFKDASIWYLNNSLLSSSQAIVATFPSSVTAAGICAVSMSGAGVVTVSAGTSGTTSPANTVSGALAADVQFAVCTARATTSLSNGGGGNQVNLASLNGINTNDAVWMDYILGSNAGNFAWTLQTSPGNWAALGVDVSAITQSANICWVKA